MYLRSSRTAAVIFDRNMGCNECRTCQTGGGRGLRTANDTRFSGPFSRFLNNKHDRGSCLNENVGEFLCCNYRTLNENDTFAKQSESLITPYVVDESGHQLIGENDFVQVAATRSCKEERNTQLSRSASSRKTLRLLHSGFGARDDAPLIFTTTQTFPRLLSF